MTDFNINVKINPSGAVVGGKKVEAALERIDKRGRQLQGLLVRALGFTAVTFAIRKAVKTLADFELEMATVKAVIGATETQFAALNKEARRLGATTKFTATQAAEGLTFLARAGFSVEESLQALSGTLQLAQAGNLGLGRAADIASNVLKGFRLEAVETARVVDVLALTANSSNTNIEQLGDALKFVAPIAAGLGVDLETTSAAIGALSDAGLQATLAGTGLRRVLGELEAPGDKTIEIFEQLGLSADQVKVSQVGLVKALQALKEAGVTTADALEIFGQRGGPAFEVLSNSIPDIIAMDEALQDAEGTVSKVAGILDATLSGALFSVSSAYGELTLALGDTGGAELLEQVMRALAGTLRFMAKNSEVVATGLVFLTGIMITQFVPALIATIAKQKVLNATLLLNPYVLVATAVAGLSFKLRSLFGEIEAIRIASEELTNAVEGSAFNKQLKVVADLEKELAGLAEANRKVDAGEEILKIRTGQVTEELEKQKIILEKLTPKQVAVVEKLKAEKVARQQLTKEFTTTVFNLKEEIRGLQIIGTERKVQIALIQLEAKLRKDGGTKLSPERKEELRLLLKRKFALIEERAALDELRGPQEAYNARLEAAQSLLDNTIIDATEFEKLKKAAAEALNGAETDLSVVIAGLQTQLGLQKLNSEEQKIQNQLLQIRGELSEDLSDENKEKEAQLNLLLRQIEIEGQLTEVQELAKISSEGIKEIQLLYNEALADGVITGAEYIAILKKIKEEQDKTTESGAKGVDLLNQAYLDLAVVGINSAFSALRELTETGKIDFERFARQLIADSLAIIARLLLIKALQDSLGIGPATAIAGAVGSGVSSLGATTPHEAGGTGFAGEGQPRIVGEGGRELFIPPTNGAIIPNAQTEQMLAGGGQQPIINVPPSPPTQVTIINSMDPQDIMDVISSDEGGDAIINHISRRRRETKEVLQ